MAVHQKHPSITALSAQQRVKQFKELFNNTNGESRETMGTRKSGKHRSNNSIAELKKRRLVNSAKRGTCKSSTNSPPKDRECRKKKPSRPMPPVPPIAAVTSMNSLSMMNPMHSFMMQVVPQPIHCQALPAWLEVTDDDHANELFFQQQQEEQQQILEISATLTFSTSIGDAGSQSPPQHTTNPLDSTVFALQQSITSPANVNKCKQGKLFDFEKTKTISSTPDTNSNETGTNLERPANCKPASDEQHNSNSSPRNHTKAIGRFIITELKYDEEMDEGDESVHEEKETVCSSKKRKKVKQWKPVSNASSAQKKGRTESLVLLRSRKLVNGGVKRFDTKTSKEGQACVRQEEHSGDETDELDLDAEHRPLPTWLAEADEMQHIAEECTDDHAFSHKPQPTDVLN